MLLVRSIQWVLDHTLRSVIFGIILLALIAGYIAIGSGKPAVREFFEMDELAFFNAWPLKLLMVLLVVTLIVVTLERIPFKPTRLGAWIVHTGIITLICGTAWHYRNKVEGSVAINVNQSVQHYYDRWERALYVRIGGQTGRAALPSLPRFNSYSESLGNARYLDRDDLKRVNPLILRIDPTNGETQKAQLGAAIGVPNLRLAVVGYWPYAKIVSRLTEDRESKAVGFALKVVDEDAGEAILMGSRPRYARAAVDAMEFEHRPLPDEKALQSIVDAAGKMHELKIKLPGYEQTLYVEVGKRYPLGNTGYTLNVESFDPSWRAMDKSVVQLLTFGVQSPTQKFRRQVISGRDKPTDWKFGEPGVGPMGKRQTEPLDTNLVTTYTFSDSAQLLPRQRLAKYTLLTAPDSQTTTIVSAGVTEASRVQRVEGSGTMTLTLPVATDALMMANLGGQPLPPAQTWTVNLRRQDRAGVETIVEEIPKALRHRDEGEAGIRQVAMIRASTPDGWKQDVLVPFSDEPLMSAWQGGLLEVPGGENVIQMALGRNYRMLPARLKLDKFEAKAYGGLDIQAASMMRDFASTLVATNPETGESVTGKASLNEPMFYQGGRWIFFQSGWDPQGQRYSVIGIGNRPGINVMIVGCVLIMTGIFYAFYLKPAMISRMKKAALAKAELAKPHPVAPAGEPELVASR